MSTTAAGRRADGAETLEIRPIAAEDKEALSQGPERLSDRSRYRRFLAPHGHLTPRELRYFTEVDHHNHEALVAVDPTTSDGVGVARYVRSKDDPTAAEVAVAVADDWQRRGVGSRLAAALVDRARKEGITKFTGLVLADNELMLNLLRDLGEVHVAHREQGCVELTIELPEKGLGHLVHLLRSLAKRELEAFPVRHSAG